MGTLCGAIELCISHVVEPLRVAFDTAFDMCLSVSYWQVTPWALFDKCIHCALLCISNTESREDQDEEGVRSCLNMLSGEFTKKSDPQTFLVYPLAKLNEVEGYARAQQKVLLKVDIATGGEGPAMDRLVACKSGGSWIAIFSSDGAPLGHDFLRNVGREVVLPACTDLHADFRVWLLTSQAMDTLPALVARNCIQLAGLQSTAEHSSLASRELVAAVECGLLQKTRECLPLIAELRADEQVELFRKAGSEELCLGLLEGETAFVVTARDAQGASVLDVGIERRFYALVERVVQCRGKTDILDFDEMLKPENRRMLELLVDNHGQAFDVLMAVHKTATDGNYAVMRRLFEARVDVDFHYTSYPMATCIRNEYRDLTQLIIDRMEMVGFPPFRDPRIALHFLLALFVPVEQRAEGQRTAFTPHVLEMAARFAEASEGHHDIPWQFVEDLVLAYPDHPLIKQLLRLVDAEKDPANYFALFLKFDPHNEMTADCLRLYLQRIALTHGNVEQAKQRLLRDVIHRGDEVAVLTKILMDDGISPNYRLELPQSGGAALERTPVMHCLDPPGHPEALKMILRRPATDVNVGNEVKLNALQQCVVDMLNRPLPYVDHLDAYGTLFEVSPGRLRWAQFGPDAGGKCGLKGRPVTAPQLPLHSSKTVSPPSGPGLVLVPRLP